MKHSVEMSFVPHNPSASGLGASCLLGLLMCQHHLGLHLHRVLTVGLLDLHRLGAECLLLSVVGLVDAGATTCSGVVALAMRCAFFVEEVVKREIKSLL